MLLYCFDCDRRFLCLDFVICCWCVCILLVFFGYVVAFDVYLDMLVCCLVWWTAICIACLGYVFLKFGWFCWFACCVCGVLAACFV